MATVNKEDCACPRAKKATCRHRPWKVSYREPGGRSGRTREVSFKLREDADKFATKVERDKDLGVYIDPKRSKITFSSIWEEWVSTGELEESTRANYRSIYRNHYEDTFGRKAIGSVTKEDVLAWRENQRQAGYSRYGIQVRANVLASVFKYAVDAEYIGRNPCKGANPRKKKNPDAYTPISDDEVPTLSEVLGIIAETPKLYRAVMWGMAGSGLRPGEALAVADQSIDWEASVLLVDHQVTSYGISDNMGGRRSYKRGTKHRDTLHARRTPIPSPVAEAYSGHVETYGTWGDRDWLFESPQTQGRHPSYQWLRTLFGNAAKAAGCPQYTPKSFRHFFASACIHSNIPMFEVAQWMGHRTSRTTEIVYAHIMEGAYTRGRRVLDGALAESLTHDLSSQHGKIEPIFLPEEEAA